MEKLRKKLYLWFLVLLTLTSCAKNISQKPEAILTINGNSARVGGMIGQSLKNYLEEGWITCHKPDTFSPFK